MLTPQHALERAQNLVSQAMKAGADAADAVYVCEASTEVQVRLGQLEDVARSEGEDIGLRVFVGQRSATISSSNMNPDILAGLVTRAIVEGGPQTCKAAAGAGACWPFLAAKLRFMISTCFSRSRKYEEIASMNILPQT